VRSNGRALPITVGNAEFDIYADGAECQEKNVYIFKKFSLFVTETGTPPKANEPRRKIFVECSAQAVG
jgi:hypothetical protein